MEYVARDEAKLLAAYTADHVLAFMPSSVEQDCAKKSLL
jgi:hypothetical protein